MAHQIQLTAEQQRAQAALQIAQATYGSHPLGSIANMYFHPENIDPKIEYNHARVIQPFMGDKYKPENLAKMDDKAIAKEFAPLYRVTDEIIENKSKHAHVVGYQHFNTHPILLNPKHFLATGHTTHAATSPTGSLSFSASTPTASAVHADSTARTTAGHPIEKQGEKAAVATVQPKPTSPAPVDSIALSADQLKTLIADAREHGLTAPSAKHSYTVSQLALSQVSVDKVNELTTSGAEKSAAKQTTTADLTALFSGMRPTDIKAADSSRIVSK